MVLAFLQKSQNRVSCNGAVAFQVEMGFESSFRRLLAQETGPVVEPLLAVTFAVRKSCFAWLSQRAYSSRLASFLAIAM